MMNALKRFWMHPGTTPIGLVLVGSGIYMWVTKMAAWPECSGVITLGLTLIPMKRNKKVAKKDKTTDIATPNKEENGK